MEIVKLEENFRGAAKKAAEVIRKGGLVVFPSDSVYGLAVDPTNQKAVDKLFRFKGRNMGKAVSVAVSDIKMSMEYVHINEKQRLIIEALTPGPFTLILEGKGILAKGVETVCGTLGIRIAKNNFMNELNRELGSPFTATSANIAGLPPHYAIKSFLKSLGEKKEGIDLIVDGGKLPQNKPSTVVDISKESIEILRKGELVGKTLGSFLTRNVRQTRKTIKFIFEKAIEKYLLQKKSLVIFLQGELGCGKTVSAKKIGKILGIKLNMPSPTFNLCHKYKLEKTVLGFGNVCHWDLYRLSGSDFANCGLIESIQKSNLSLIEWPERLDKAYLDKIKSRAIILTIKYKYLSEKEREIEYFWL